MWSYPAATPKRQLVYTANPTGQAVRAGQTTRPGNGRL